MGGPDSLPGGSEKVPLPIPAEVVRGEVGESQGCHHCWGGGWDDEVIPSPVVLSGGKLGSHNEPFLPFPTRVVATEASGGQN